MHSLPIEILGEIFWWCSPTLRDRRYPPLSSLYLSHVCRLWRHASISTPRLWTYTKVVVRQFSLRSPLELMKLWFIRAKSCPLLVDVQFVEKPDGKSPGTVLSLFQEIVLTAQRYRSIPLANPHVESRISASSSETIPLLTERHSWNAGQELLPSNALGSHVEYMKIHAVRYAEASFAMDLHLPLKHTLTYLEVKDHNGLFNLTNEECISILSNFPYLVHCTLHINYPRDVESDMVRLQHLKYLSLSWGDLLDVGPLLDSIDCPSLEALELLGILPEETEEASWDHLYQLLLRCQPPLRYLDLGGIDCFFIGLLNCLPLSPNLERLWLDDCILDDSILAGLHKRADNTGRRAGVLSTLKTLGLVSCCDFSVDLLINILHASKRNDSSLEELYVIDCEEVDEAQKLAFEALNLGDGLHVIED